jgi:hypothetical protein
MIFIADTLAKYRERWHKKMRACIRNGFFFCSSLVGTDVEWCKQQLASARFPTRI